MAVVDSPAERPAAPRHALAALLVGNLLIGTGVLLPAGMLNDLAARFSVDAPTAGLLMLASGLVVGFGAPILAGLTSRVERRRLLVAALGLYAAGHAAMVLAPSFGVLLGLRAITMVAAAVFTPQAAATAGLLVPPERRAAAIAFIFIGWSVASVAGIPLGTYLSARLGGPSVFAAMAALSAAGGLLVWRSLPGGLRSQPLDLAAWRSALTSPVLLVILLVTVLSMSGQFAIFSYFAPILAEGFGAGAAAISLAFAVAGAAGVLGNAAASRLAGPLGVDRAVTFALVLLIAGFALFWASFGQLWLAFAAVALWGLGSFSGNSLQQSRLVGRAPALAPATVALNTSAVYLGQAAGTAAGAAVLRAGALAEIGLVALAFAVAALAASLWAARLGRA